MSTLKEFNENEEEVAAIFQTEDEPFQRQTAQRFSHISTIQKVNLCFWMICWNLPQFIVAIVLCALYFRTCIEQTIWILIYVSLSILIWGIIWTIFYAETGCVHLVRLEIVYLILGVCGISFVSCNCLILCLRETSFLGSSNLDSILQKVPEWRDNKYTNLD